MATRYAWVLNLDADLELAAGARYTPSNAIVRAVAANVPRAARALLGAGDVLIEPRAEPGSARGLVGRAFCPTPRALTELRRAGSELGPQPTVDVLRRVNARSFASELGATLPGAVFVLDLAAARAAVRRSPAFGRGWRLKSAYGMAGRGQRVVSPERLDANDDAFLIRGIASGGLQIEPNVQIVEEFAVHGWLNRAGALLAGQVVSQCCDARGAWLVTKPVPETRRREPAFRDVEARLGAELRRVGTALYAAGYFGPFGVDAYLYRTSTGAVGLQPRSEINARYSMGYGVGFDRGTISPG